MLRPSAKEEDRMPLTKLQQAALNGDEEEWLRLRKMRDDEIWCSDCGHHMDAHSEYGTCDICQDNLDDMPGGAQGAHVEPCPSRGRDDEE